MSFRKKTIKFGETFGTPTTPTPTPKAPSPKAPQIVRTITPTVTTGVRVTPKPTGQRGQIPQSAAGIAVQEQFKTQLQNNPIVRAATEVLGNLLGMEKYYAGRYDPRSPADKLAVQNKIEKEQQKIKDEENRLIEIELSGNVNQIIGALESGKQLYPDWFQNNIIWVKTGQITSQAFLDSYYYLSNQGIIHSPMAEPIIEEPIIEEPIIEEPIIELPELLPEAIAEPQIDDSITTNMVTQQLINFNIVNGRAVGSIKFVATNNFNPYYYNKNIVNIIQIKDPNGVNILTTVKQNTLNFTETERDEIINYDEDVKQNTRATVESFVWEWIDKPAGAFSNKYTIDISETEPPKPTTSGFMGAGIAGAIAGLVLIGFIADHKRGK